MNSHAGLAVSLLVVVSAGLPGALAEEGSLAGPPGKDQPLCRTWAAKPLPPKVIDPADLQYRGAFRVPAGWQKGKATWSYGGGALAYFPEGDPRGPADGYAGSLFGAGHAHECLVSEVSIPVPVLSAGKDLKALHTARTLQPFADVTVVIGPDGKPQPTRYRVMGLECLAPQGRQKTAKLYFCKSTHFQYGGKESTHGWSETTLSRSKAAGLWNIDTFHSSAVNHYIFEIPKVWADVNTPGLRLATGRHRVGISGSNGPCLYAYGPWNDGNPPPTDARLKGACLLYYSMRLKKKMTGFLAADGWKGGAWLAAGSRAAVVLVGRKAFGRCWYGLKTRQGVPVVKWGKRYEDAKGQEVKRADLAGGRGYKADFHRAFVLFFDPADLAAVAKGRKKPHEPQPYAGLDVNAHLFGRGTLGGAAYDRRRRLLYVFESGGDGDRPLVHVWQVRVRSAT